MLLTGVLVSALIHACVGRHLEAAPHATPNLRIINGKDAEPHVAPYLALVVLQVAGVEAYCGGTLIHQQFVLTAASCLSAPKTEIDRVGLGLYSFNQTEPLQELQATAIAIHEAYTADKSTSHDVALIKLERPANITIGQVETVELPSSATFPDKQNSYESKPGTLYGWGATLDGSTAIPHVLQTLEVRVQPSTRCQSADRTSAREDGLCVGRADGTLGVTCKGDEGSPLVVAGVQAGVLGRRAKTSCSENSVTFVARVDYNVDWIKKTINKL